jgi:hypothetical protein
MFALSVPQLLWSRRTLFMALVAGAPVLLAAGARAAAENGAFEMRLNGADVGGLDVFRAMASLFFLRFAVPVLGAFYGTALIADEVDDRTITYLFVRPIPRAAVLGGKYLACLACTMLVVLPATVLVYLALVPAAAILTETGELAHHLAVLALGLAAYAALFALMGVWVKRPLMAGLVFAFGWEPVALLVPGYLRQFTIAQHLQSLAPQGTSSNVAADVGWLLVITAGCLVLAGRLVERREFALDSG